MVQYIILKMEGRKEGRKEKERKKERKKDRQTGRQTDKTEKEESGIYATFPVQTVALSWQITQERTCSIKVFQPGSSRHGSMVTNLTSVHEVCSLALFSGLRIQRCRELWCRSQMELRSGAAVAVVSAGSHSSDSTPSLETSICLGCGPKKRERQNKQTNQKKTQKKISW